MGRPRIHFEPKAPPKYATKPIEIGERHGQLVVLSRTTPQGTKHPKYLLRCDCGKEYEGYGTVFRDASSCRDCCTMGKPLKYRDNSIAGTKLYASWVAMRRRCNPEVEPERNARWAGRGISVCLEWEEFATFEEWSLSNGYMPGLSLDRVDNDGNYEPSNCEWVTRSENSKRARALYHFIEKTKSAYNMPYDDPCYGDA